MKLKTIIPLLLLPSLLVGCNDNKSKVPSEGEVSATLNPIMKSDSEGYNLKFLFKDAWFKESAKAFNKELMQLSFGAFLSAENPTNALSFYTAMGFDSFYASQDYLISTNENTVGFVFAHKQIEDFNLVSVSIRSQEYGTEWANNVNVGKEGNHVGFEQATNKVLANLEVYLKQFTDNRITKFWLSGYSRGGSIANILSSKLLTGTDVRATEDTLFTYTFNAPRALTKENAVAYPNVFNMVNDADLISRLLPEEYGLYRCGVDKELYDETVDELLAELDPELTLEEFEPDTGEEPKYTTELGFVDYCMDLLLYHDEDETFAPYVLQDREHFYTIQDKVRYLLATIMSMPDFVNVIMDKVGTMSMTELFMLLTDDGMYAFLSGLLDEHNVAYDVDFLKASIHSVLLAVQRYLEPIVNIALGNNGKRLIKMHYPETVYVLALNYEEPVQA